MAIVKQYSKRSNTTYVYDASYRWDPELKQSRSVRKLIGKIDEETGEIVPTSGKPGRPKKDPDNAESKVDSESRKSKTADSNEQLLSSLKKQIKEKDEMIASLQQEIRSLHQADERKTDIIRKMKELIDVLDV